MHPLSFLQKRGHLSAVATGRKMFARVKDMTPARFDLLYVIHEHGRQRGSRSTSAMTQVELRRRLGLARQTVWKMVVRLVDLGLLTKRRDDYLGYRRILVELTHDGLRRIREACSSAFTERYPIPTDGDRDVQRQRYRLVRDAATKADNIAAIFAAMKSSTVDDLARSTAPARNGREVAKIYTSFAWRRAGGGRRNRRFRHLELLDGMIQDAREIARAFGDTSDLLYPLRYDPDH